MSSDHRYNVAGCRTCHQYWIAEDYKLNHQSSITCPHCDTQQPVEKVRSHGPWETREAAAEARSRILAKESGEADTYQRVIDNHGQYDEQAAEIDRQVDAFTVDAELMDLRPIGTDRFAHQVEQLEKRQERRNEWLEKQVEERCGPSSDAFADLIDLRPADADRFQEEVDELLDGYAERPDRAALPRGEMKPTNQAIGSAIIELAEGTKIKDVWSQLFEHENVHAALEESLTQLFDGMDVLECFDVLEEEYIPFWLRSPIVNVARGSDDEVARLANELIPNLPNNPLAANEDTMATATLFAGLERRFSVAVVVHENWLTDPDRADRVAVCDLLAVLAANLDVRVCSSGIVLQQLARKHRLDLPGVNDWRVQTRGGSEFEDLVNAAVDELDTDDREVAILRALYEEGGDPVSYTELYADYAGTNSRIRQCLSKLHALELVDKFDSERGAMVELLEAGKSVLEAFEKETARQRRLESFVTQFSQSCAKGRVTPDSRSPPEETPVEGDDGASEPWTTRYLSTADHAAAVASAEDGAVTLVPGGFDETEDKKRWVSYDADRDEAVVAVKAAGPMTYVSSSAIALASPEFLDSALPAERLSSIDEPPIIVREGRCIGGASDDALADPKTLRSKLIDWGKEIEDLTRRFKHGEYGEFENGTELRKEILRKSHGLFGTIVSLLDAVGIDIVREIRVPNRADKDRQLGKLAVSIAISVAIQSTYRGVFACYRHLFEKRTEKRQRALTPKIDATNPYGKLIGSIVIRGPDVHRLEPKLRHFLEEPADENEEPLEIAVNVPIQYVDRDAFAVVAARILSKKNLRPPRELVSLFYALVESPHDLAYGLQHRLSREETRREMRPDEARKALAGVGHEALCPDLPRTVGKILVGLLEAEKPLSKAELADRADVSVSSIYRNEAKLEAIDLLSKEDDEYRVTLSFPEKAERRSPVVPKLLAGGEMLDVVDELLLNALPPDRYGDPDDPLGGLLFDFPGDPLNPWGLADHKEFSPWVEIAARLLDDDTLEETSVTTVSMGPGPATIQQPLAGSDASAADSEVPS